MGFWSGVKNCYIGLGNGLEMVSEKIEELNRDLEVIGVKLDEKINEHEAKKPFLKIKMDAHKINHNVQIASIVIPKDYKYTHGTIECISEIANIVMGVMDAVVDNPNKRTYMLEIINTVQAQLIKEYNYIYEMINTLLEELYNRGLDRDADIGEKIKFLLECETDDDNLENVMRDTLPNFQEVLKTVRSTQSELKKKVIVIN